MAEYIDDEDTIEIEPTDLAELKEVRDKAFEIFEKDISDRENAVIAYEAAGAYFEAAEHAFDTAQDVHGNALIALKTAENEFAEASEAFEQRKDELGYDEALMALEAVRDAYVAVRTPYEAVRIDTEAAQARLDDAQTAFDGDEGDLADAQSTLESAENDFNTAWDAYMAARAVYDASSNLRTEFDEAYEAYARIESELQGLLQAALDAHRAVAYAQDDVKAAHEVLEAAHEAVEEARDFVNIIVEIVDGVFMESHTGEGNAVVTVTQDDICDDGYFYYMFKGNVYRVEAKEGPGTYALEGFEGAELVENVPESKTVFEADVAAQHANSVEVPAGGHIFISKEVEVETEGETVLQTQVFRIDNKSEVAVQFALNGAEEVSEADYNAFVNSLMEADAEFVQVNGTYFFRTDNEDGTFTVSVGSVGTPTWMKLQPNQIIVTGAVYDAFVADQIAISDGSVRAGTHIIFEEDGRIVVLTGSDNGWYKIPDGARIATAKEVEDFTDALTAAGGDGYIRADENGEYFYSLGGSVFRVEGATADTWHQLPVGAVASDAAAHELYLENILIALRTALNGERTSFDAAQDAFAALLEAKADPSNQTFIEALAVYRAFIIKYFPDQLDDFDASIEGYEIRLAIWNATAVLRATEADFFEDPTLYKEFLQALEDYIGSDEFKLETKDRQDHLIALFGRMEIAFDEAETRNQDRIDQLEELVENVQAAIKALEPFLDKTAWSQESLMERIASGELSHTGITGNLINYRNTQTLWVNRETGQILTSVPSNAGAGQVNAGYSRFDAGQFIFTGNMNEYGIEGSARVWVNADGRVTFNTSNTAPSGSGWTQIGFNNQTTGRDFAFNPTANDLNDLQDVVDMMALRQAAFDEYIDAFSEYWIEWFKIEANDPDRDGGSLNLVGDELLAWAQTEALKVVNAEIGRFEDQTQEFQSYLTEMSEYMWFQAQLAGVPDGQWILATHPVTGKEVILAGDGAFLSYRSNLTSTVGTAGNPCSNGLTRTHTPLDANYIPITQNHFEYTYQINTGTSLRPSWQTMYSAVPVSNTGGSGSNAIRNAGVNPNYNGFGDALPTNANGDLRWDSWSQVSNQSVTVTGSYNAVHTETFTRGVWNVPTDDHITTGGSQSTTAGSGVSWRNGANQVIDWIHHESEVNHVIAEGAPPALQLDGVKDFPPPTYFAQGETTGSEWTFTIEMVEFDPEDPSYESNGMPGSLFEVILEDITGDLYTYAMHGNLTPDLLEWLGELPIWEFVDRISTYIDIALVLEEVAFEGSIDDFTPFETPVMPDLTTLDPLAPLTALVNPLPGDLPGDTPPVDIPPGDIPPGDTPPDDTLPGDTPTGGTPFEIIPLAPAPDPALVPAPAPIPPVPVEGAPVFEIDGTPVPLAFTPPAVADSVPTIIIEDAPVPLAALPGSGEIAGFITTGLILASLIAAVVGNSIRKMRTEETEPQEKMT